jgi:hypothetical protein
LGYYLAKGGTEVQGGRRAEILAGGYFVETPFEPLNGNVLWHGSRESKSGG